MERSAKKTQSLHRNRAYLPLLILLLSCSSAIVNLPPRDANSQLGQSSARNLAPCKKILQWGWGEPNPGSMRRDIVRMERQPFDGVVFNLVTPTGEPFATDFWGLKLFTLSDFRESLEDLKATPFKRFTDLFLRVNLSAPSFDWFSEDDWKRVLANTAVAAQVAKEGKTKGFLFDVEQYSPHTLLDYKKQRHHDSKTFLEYSRQVKQRGEEWIREVNRYYPDITILFTFGYEHAQPRKWGQSRSDSESALLSDFLDGILLGATPNTSLVDAWESSYGYKKARHFDDAYRTIKKDSAKWSVLPDKYRSQFMAGFALWMDFDSQEKGWNVQDPKQNYFTPQQFAGSLELAIQKTDRYVWIYTEKPNWWTNQQLPTEYVEAVIRARNLLCQAVPLSER